MMPDSTSLARSPKRWIRWIMASLKCRSDCSGADGIQAIGKAAEKLKSGWTAWWCWAWRLYWVLGPARCLLQAVFQRAFARCGTGTREFTSKKQHRQRRQPGAPAAFPVVQANTPESGWGIVVISKSGETIKTAVAFRQCGGPHSRVRRRPRKASQLIIPVTGKTGRLPSFQQIGCKETVSRPRRRRRAVSISAVGLVPAAYESTSRSCCKERRR
jgi:hypothetical protein